MHTRSTTNICTKVSRYLGNVDFVAPPSASLLSSPPSPCHPYDPRDFPSFLISIVPSGKRRSRPLDSSKWRKWEWSLSSCRELWRWPISSAFCVSSSSSRTGAIACFIGSEISLATPRRLFLLLFAFGRSFDVSKAQSFAQTREKSRSDGEGLFRWLDVRVCD